MTSVNDVWMRMRALVEQAALYDLAASLLDPPSRRTGEAPDVDLGPYGRGASEDALIDVVLELQLSLIHI